MPTEKDKEVHIDERDAKSGRQVKGMTIVLALSTVAAAVLLFLIFGFFAG